MQASNILFSAIKKFIVLRIISKHKDLAVLKEKQDFLEVIDKSASRIKLTFVFWEGSHRITMLIDDREIMDHECENINDIVTDIDCIISNEILKTERFRRDKLIYRKYEYSTIINGKVERIKDESRFGFSWFSKPEVKVTHFSPW